LAKPGSFVFGAMYPGSGRAAERDRRGRIGMEHPKSLDRNRISHHRADEPVPPVFAVAESVAVLDSRFPSGDVTGPFADLIIRPDVLAENLASPTIVVAGDPEDGKSRIAQLGERGEGAKAPPR